MTDSIRFSGAGIAAGLFTYGGQHLGAEAGDVLLGAGGVAGAFDHEYEVAQAGAVHGGGEALDAVGGGADRVDPAQQVGVAGRIPGWPWPAVYRQVAASPGPSQRGSWVRSV